MSEIKYEVVDKLAVLSEREGWKKEVRLVAWNGRDAKIDIREWATDGSGRMTKGITLTADEFKALQAVNL